MGLQAYLFGALFLLGGAFAVAFLVQTSRLETAQTEVALERAKLETCGGRLDAVLRDVKSDNEIDDLDLLDFTIPSDWMRPDAATGN